MKWWSGSNNITNKDKIKKRKLKYSAIAITCDIYILWGNSPNNLSMAGIKTTTIKENRASKDIIYKKDLL